jgi:undecaprenyl-phosphate 4-deoxy-4-formamido-L-arabinose transferase
VADERDSISVVVPVYNGALTLETLTHRLLATLSGMGRRFEIVFVNDGSRDESWSTIQRLAQTHSPIVGIDLMRNYGQHNALLCGIRSARYDLTVTLDDDLQQPPEEIPRLVEMLERGGADVVYGAPATEQHGAVRNVASRLMKVVMKRALGADIAPMVSTFRVFRTQLRTAFEQTQNPQINVDVLLTWATSRFAAVSVPSPPREAGKSSYSFRSLVRHTFNMVTGFSVLPLQIATLVGFACMLFGVGVLVFVLVRYVVEGSNVPGFPFLASIVAIFSGAQLFALGIMGEYLGRMHLRTMERPPYAVRQRAGTSRGA